MENLLFAESGIQDRLDQNGEDAASKIRHLLQVQNTKNGFLHPKQWGNSSKFPSRMNQLNCIDCQARRTCGLGDFISGVHAIVGLENVSFLSQLKIVDNAFFQFVRKEGGRKNLIIQKIRGQKDEFASGTQHAVDLAQ